MRLDTGSVSEAVLFILLKFSLLNKPSEESSQPKCDGDKPSKEDEQNDSASHDPYYPPVIRFVSLIILRQNEVSIF